MNEQILFNLIKSQIPDLQRTDQFSFRDGYSPRFDLTIELKCRYKHYEGLLIEKMKWDKLIKCNRVYYINSTPIGIFLFDLKNIPEPIWDMRDMPHTTEFEDTAKINKLVGLLSIYQAKDISHLIRRI